MSRKICDEVEIWSNVKASDRPWNDPGPSRGGAIADQENNEKRPILHAIVLDFSQVSHIDTTAVQALIDTRTEVEKWVDHPVEFHFATVLSPWIRRALTAGGFGLGISASRTPQDLVAVVPYRGGRDDINSELEQYPSEDIENHNIKKTTSHSTDQDSEFEPIIASDTPFFHIDLQAAVQAAESGVGRLTGVN